MWKICPSFTLHLLHIRYVSFYTFLEPDATHHRLVASDQRSHILRTFENHQYHCYDCFERFANLTELVVHCNLHPSHSSEYCLKCKDKVIVFIKLDQQATVRYHCCKRADLKHENSNLHILSHIIPCPNTKGTVICDNCPTHFNLTNKNGIYEFLVHSNCFNHNVTSSCRKCSLPRFVLRLQTNIIAHYCIQTTKPVIECMK